VIHFAGNFMVGVITVSDSVRHYSYRSDNAMFQRNSDQITLWFSVFAQSQVLR